MSDLQTRPFSKDYSGLINQSVIAVVITVICITSQELMKRRRRGSHSEEGLGSRESWEFGYLYQGRSWAKNPSPPSPRGWPLSWVKQAIRFPEDKLLELRGIDATLYIRFLRGCFWFALLHTLTTFPILFPIHVEFSEESVSPKSMTRASISSLVRTAKGKSLLWIHMCLLFWVTLSWMMTLLWICNGAFGLRKIRLKLLKERSTLTETGAQYSAHPHPQYGFTEILVPDRGHPNKGLRLRTVMVSNVPHPLRSEKALKEYFEFYMSRKLEKPSMGITSSTRPGFLNKSFAFMFNRAKRLPVHLPSIPLISPADVPDSPKTSEEPETNAPGGDSNVPIVEHVVVVRKMTEIASLLERREEILRLLETAHIKLARNALIAVKTILERRNANLPVSSKTNRATEVSRKRRSIAVDVELGKDQEVILDEAIRMDQLIEVLGPFVEEFRPPTSLSLRSRKFAAASSKYAFRKLRAQPSEDSDHTPTTYPPTPHSTHKKTIWEALNDLPRSSLDAYQPLVNLSHLFRGKTVPSIDYYTAKLNLLSSLVTEGRSKAVNDYHPVSTAFVTFADPADARRACKYLAVHPNNPLACVVTMAPMYQDLDWTRVMKSSFNAEFVKDWVVNVGVWAFTLSWLFPVSLLVGLVSIQNISLFWPSLKAYLDRHQWEEEVIQSFLPTLLVALLALLIPLILLLIAKKAHNLTTLSAMHDKIMSRYYKFLIVNVLVFFCVGTVALQSFLLSFRPSKDESRLDVLQVVADSFPSAGPFYVGWLIFTTAMHAGFEIALSATSYVPKYVAPSHTAQARSRDTTPNIQLLLLASQPSPALYFFVQTGVVKNQLIHVYAKHYEGNGQLILIRIVRYSLDGLLFTQGVYLAYMVVLKKSVNVGLAAFLIVFSALVKLVLTRMCRIQFAQDDIEEANVICGHNLEANTKVPSDDPHKDLDETNGSSYADTRSKQQHSSVLTWRLPEWVSFSYSTMRRRQRPRHRQPNPFRPQHQEFSRLNSPSPGHKRMAEKPDNTHTKPPLNEFPWGTVSPLLQNSNIPDLAGMIAVHPRLVPWDDETTVDLPYDNPFYTRPYSNSLWLPRNPFLLDLNDTVDLKIPLCVDPAAAKIGTWLGVEETASPEEIPERPTSASASQTYTAPTPVDGTEDIDLPPTIVRRVQSGESDIEQAEQPRRPSAYRRKLSTATISSSGTGRSPQSPSSMRQSSLLAQRRGSVLESNGISPQRERSSSILSVMRTPSHLPHSKSQELSERPRFQAHAEVLSAPANVSESHLSLALPGRPQNITARKAIAHEVLAEEKAALIDRIEEEEAQTQKETAPRSWVTAWMFRKRD